MAWTSKFNGSTAGHQYELRLTVTPVSGSASVANNTSTVSWTLEMVKLSGKGYNSGYTHSWSVNIGGIARSGTRSGYNFANYSTLLLGSGTETITHNSDGSKTIYSTGAFTAASTIGSASVNGNTTLPTINRVPNVPTLSSSNIAVSSARVNWSTNLPVKTYSYRTRPSGGSWTSWTNVNVSNVTSGNFTISGSAGTTYNVEVQLLGQYVTTWTSSGTINVTLLNQSTLSNLTVTPVYGTNNQLIFNFSIGSTGGTSYAEYQVGSTWVAMSNGTVITGLSEGTSYTYNFRARNSSGVINTYSRSGTTHTRPNGSFDLTQSNKTKITITLSSLTNTTDRYYSQNSGSNQWFSENSITLTGLNPGSTYTYTVRLYSTTTGLERILSAKSLQLSSLASVTLAAGSISRNAANIGMTFSDTVSQYQYRQESGSWSAVTFSGTSTSRSLSGFNSGTSYTYGFRGYDSSASLWGPETTITFTTSVFRTPTVTFTAGLTSITATYTIRDSCSGISTHEGSWSTGELANNTTINYTFTKDSLGAIFSANTNYTLTATFKDTYGTANTAVQGSSRTAAVSQVAASWTTSSIVSLTENYPSLIITTPLSVHKRIAKITLGSVVLSNQVIPVGTSSLTINLNQAQTTALVTAAQTTSATALVEMEYEEGGRISPSKTNTTAAIALSNSLLIMPSLPTDHLTYSSYSSGGTTLNLAALVNYNINSASLKVTIPASGPAGSTIAAARITFNGVTHTLTTSSGTKTVTLSSEGVISNANAVYSLTDSRGLTNSSSIPVAIFNYQPPRIEVGSVIRVGGFGESLIARNLVVNYDIPPVSSGSKNIVNEIEVKYKVGTSSTEVLYGKMSITPTVGTTSGRYPATGVANFSIPATSGGLFAVSQSYVLSFRVSDLFNSKTGLIGSALNLTVPTGQPIAFYDKVNRRLGINTTAPQSSLEVVGDIYANNVYSTTTLYFDIDDLE